MPKQINTPSPGQALVRMFSLKGRFQPVLDEVIVPVVQVPLDAPASKRFAAWGTTMAAGGAGTQGRAFIENTAQSGHLVVLTKVWAKSGIAAGVDTFGIEIVAGSIAASGIGEFTDSRIDDQKPVARTGGSTGATAVSNFPYYPCETVPMNVEWIIEPGNYLFIRQQGENVTFAFNYVWYEVALRGGSSL